MKTRNKQELNQEQEAHFEPSGDGMGFFTAKFTIRHELKKKLIKKYNIIELTNRGRYYYALVETRDGRWTHQLLIDKQSGSVQEVSAEKNFN